jgi:hypothetical protein
VDVVFEIAREQGVGVVGYPLGEGGGVVVRVMCDWRGGDEDGAEAGGGRVFDLQGGGQWEAGYCWARLIN